MTEKEIQEIAYKYLKGETTPEEEAFLHQWYEVMGYDKEELVVKTHGEESEDIKNRLFSRLRAEIRKDIPLNHQPIWNKKWTYYAASFFLILTFSVIYYSTSEQPAMEVHYTELLKNDVGPGGDNAILELGNGTIINLDQANIGDLVDLDGFVVSKIADGMLSFEVSNSQNKESNQMNSIRTPQGGQYKLKLPDGTEVWLNTSSILKFPNAFEEGIRQVELIGEAYFEVAQLKDEKNKPIPFYVNSKQQQVEVLGTHFMVSSYPDETIVKTTLLEGSVRVLALNSTSNHVLVPGQQSQIQNGQLDVREADIESEIAWKNGDFIFNNESLESIMKKIERWYDVEVDYQSPNKGFKFSGAVSRSKNLSEVLNIIELTGKIEFKIEGRRVIIMR